jgi:hypothetical protein
MNRKQRRTAKKMEVGTKIETAIFGVSDAEGRNLGVFWCVVPDGMTREDAMASQTVHGPFATIAEVNESQRVELFGEQCQVKEGTWQ